MNESPTHSCRHDWVRTPSRGIWGGSVLEPEHHQPQFSTHPGKLSAVTNRPSLLASKWNTVHLNLDFTQLAWRQADGAVGRE